MSVGDTGETGRLVPPRRVQHGNGQFSDLELESCDDYWPADWTASIRVQPVDEGGLLHYVLVSREMIFEELHLGTVPCPVEISNVTNVTPREWLALRTWVLLHRDYSLPRADEPVTTGIELHRPDQYVVDQLLLHWGNEWRNGYRSEIETGQLPVYARSCVLRCYHRRIETIHLGPGTDSPLADGLTSVTPLGWLSLRTWVRNRLERRQTARLAASTGQQLSSSTALVGEVQLAGGSGVSLVSDNGQVAITAGASAEPHSMDLPRLEMLGQQFTQPLSEFNIGDAQLATMTEWPLGCVAEALLGQMLSRLRRSYRLSVVTPDGMRAVEWLHTGSENWPITVADERALTPQEWLTLRHWIHDNQRAVGDTVLDVESHGLVVSVRQLTDMTVLEPIGRHEFRGELLLGNEELRAWWPPGYRCWQREPDNLRLCRSYHLEYLEPGREPVLVEQINLGGNDCDMLPQFPNDISPEEWRNLRDWVDWHVEVMDEQNSSRRISELVSEDPRSPSAAVPARSGSTTYSPVRDEQDWELIGNQAACLPRGNHVFDTFLYVSDTSLRTAGVTWGYRFSARSVASAATPQLDNSFGLFYEDQLVERIDLNSTYGWEPPRDINNVTPAEWYRLRLLAREDDSTDHLNMVASLASEDRRSPPVAVRGHYLAPNGRVFYDDSLRNTMEWGGAYSARRLASSDAPTELRRSYAMFNDGRATARIDVGPDPCPVEIADHAHVTPDEWLRLRLYVHGQDHIVRDDNHADRPSRIVHAPGLEPRDVWLNTRDEWGSDSPFHVSVVWDGQNVVAYVLYQVSRIVEELRTGSYVCDVRIADINNVTPREWLMLRRWVRMHTNIDLQNGVVGEAGEPSPSVTTSNYVVTYDDAPTQIVRHALVCTYFTDLALRQYGAAWPAGCRVDRDPTAHEFVWHLRYYDMIIETIVEVRGDSSPLGVPVTPLDWLQLREWVRTRAELQVVARDQSGAGHPGLLERALVSVSNPAPVRGRRVISLDADSEDEHVG